jgi:anti-sigma B factor antagonist
MLSITKTKDGDKLTVKIKGEMDSSNASQFSETVEEDLDSVMEIFIDMSELDYTTSAGLREMLAAYQVLDEKDGRMVLQHPNDEIKEVLELTGFVHFLEVED